MPSYLNSLRMRSIFANPEDTQTPGMKLPKRFLSGVTNDFNPDDTGDDDPATTSSKNYFDEQERMRSQMKAGPARSAYMKSLEEMPVESDPKFEPSKKRKFGAIMAGIGGTILNGGIKGGMGAYDQVAKAPYFDERKDWEDKISKLGESAKLEESDISGRMKNFADAQKYGLDYTKFLTEHGDKVADRNERDKYHTGLVSSRNRTAATGEQNSRNNQAYQSALVALQKGQLSISEFNAMTQRMSQQTTAGLGLANLDIARGRADTYKKTAGKSPASSTQQAYAVDNALREFHRDPRFRDFVHKDEATGRYDYKEVDDATAKSLMYQEFSKKMRAIIDSSRKTGNPMAEDDDPDDGSIVIGAPVSRRR